MSDQDDDSTKPETDDVDADRVDDEPDGADQLGDAGKKALDAMKAKWQRERDQRKALADELAKLKAPKGEEEDQVDPDEIRKQAQAEARAEVLRDRALDKVEAKAAKLFADPEDARALLAARVDDFVDDGQVDTDAITEALDDLLKKKPHLAAKADKRFAGSADGGARKGSKPDQLTRQDLKRMTPAQIVKAQEEGRLADLMGVDT
ncbi:hypothetical protein ACFHW1_04995 [Micromonospora sp. LOL_014]|uniref:hypothetical protein n=1 Tax=Micromonospora sp. LOL_014 TaxID=3345415 RepID=UPI003A896C63